MTDKAKNKKYIIFIIEIFAAAILVLVDQLIKNAVVKGLKGQSDIVLIKNIIGLTYAENTGAAFSFMSGSTMILSIFTLVLLLGGIVALFLNKIPGKLMKVCAVSIIAGGTGNLIDRFSQGFVVDYIETLFVNFPVYNFADILVTCGVTVVCIYLVYDMVREEKLKKAQKNGGEDTHGNS